MMSQHLSSMLEHLKVGSLKKVTKTPPATLLGENAFDKDKNSNVTSGATSTNSSYTTTSDSSGSGRESDGERRARTIMNPPSMDERRLSVIANHTSSVAGGRKLSGSENGDVKQRIIRDLSPSSAHHRGSTSGPSNNQRKLSQDLRFIDHLDGSGKSKSSITKPMRLRCIATKVETYDTLYSKGPDNFESMYCSRKVCLGSVMHANLTGVECRKMEDILEHAKDFVDQYYTSIRRLNSPAHETRWRQVQANISISGGQYHLTETELIFGAKLAWRNASRCIGRIQWSKLQVFDCRYVTTTSQMFEAICNHIKYATNKGNLRSAITIFPQRTDGRHDFRIWNNQIISYAGYRMPDGSILGDPLNVEFTEICLKLGWKGKKTAWDILPLVVSANGHDPDFFDYSSDLIIQIPLTHPTYSWFSDLNLRWYALPAVSSMMFDCGGIQFTGTVFSGWYMSTEIGCRNLCDPHRRNLLEPIAIKMGLDVRNPTTLWKDKALVEINIAVLHSYQKMNVTIVDHHTASESFMKHYENESKLRNGCPADWVWIVPPMSASITMVFHQEMAVYYPKPSFEYQEVAWKTHIWKKGRDSTKSKKPRKKFHFKQIARAVKFTSKLFGRALSRRIKATVLYATETGRSEQYAKQLCELLSHAFNAQVYCMTEYDISSIEHEALLLVVASTFGNGDPPENGESFAHDLYSMKLQEMQDENYLKDNLSNIVTSKSFIKANSRNERGNRLMEHPRKIDRLDSLRGSTLSDTNTEDTFGPLSNVRFAIFALGSSAYPNFCSFGKYLDNILGDLGGERLLKMATGDEMCGQEQTFRKWAPEVFKLACETFCLDPDETLSVASLALQNDLLTINTVRLAVPTEINNLLNCNSLNLLLTKFHNKKTTVCKLKCKPINLHDEQIPAIERSTILVKIIANGVTYEPGDHLGIFPENRTEIVNGILKRITGFDNPDEILQLQILKENQTSNGIFKSWEPHERLPVCTVRTLFSRFLDITTPPSRQLLNILASCCENKEDEGRLNILAIESSAYEDWRHWRSPHLLEVLEEFPSCHPPAGLLAVHLMPLQPRFYSISSSQLKYKNEIHLTVAVVKYQTEDGEGPEHYGVCSNYLESLDADGNIYLFVRSAPLFHMPTELTQPVILIGPGTGIAPFRSFWQHWDAIKTSDPETQLPRVLLFFGCRTKTVDLYHAEKQDMVKKNVLTRTFLALSREANYQKTYVQDLALKEAESIYNILINENGHVYVCGDVTMAEHVYQTLRKIIATQRKQTENSAEKIMLSLRDENRYHEDIFGITLRTAEIHNKSRASARIRMASQS